MRPKADAAPYLFLLPSLLGLLTFSILPISAALAISLTNWDLLTEARFVGLNNYRALAVDPLFRQVAANTLLFVLGTVPTTMALGLGLALALQRQKRGSWLFRGMFFLPVVISSVAAAVVWRWLYSSDFGLINAGLAQVGVPGVPWLSASEWALPSVIVAAIWKGLGYDVVVFLAGLQAIPSGLYEAADLDGASAWQRLRHVTLPMLAPTTLFVLIVALVRSFQVFDLAYVLTGGGPANATNTMVMFVYQSAFQHFRMGYASAAAWVLFALIVAVTMLRARRRSGWAYYD